MSANTSNFSPEVQCPNTGATKGATKRQRGGSSERTRARTRLRTETCFQVEQTILTHSKNEWKKDIRSQAQNKEVSEHCWLESERQRKRTQKPSIKPTPAMIFHYPLSHRKLKPNGIIPSNGEKTDLGLAHAPRATWNDWPTGTCCTAQGPLPNPPL